MDQTFTNTQICFLGEWVGVIYRLTNVYEKNKKCHYFYLWSQGTIQGTFSMNKKYEAAWHHKSGRQK